MNMIDLMNLGLTGAFGLSFGYFLGVARSHSRRKKREQELVPTFSCAERERDVTHLSTRFSRALGNLREQYPECKSLRFNHEGKTLKYKTVKDRYGYAGFTPEFLVDGGIVIYDEKLVRLCLENGAWDLLVEKVKAKHEKVVAEKKARKEAELVRVAPLHEKLDEILNKFDGKEVEGA